MKKIRYSKTAPLNVNQGAGFSIVEMLIVIAVIGIISAIAIPSISDISKRAKDANIRRNAQNLNSIYASAQSAGHDFAYEDGDNSGDVLSEADIIRAIIDGIEISGSGPLAGTFLGVKGLNKEIAVDEENGAAKYLEWSAVEGGLVYTGNK